MSNELKKDKVMFRKKIITGCGLCLAIALTVSSVVAIRHKSLEMKSKRVSNVRQNIVCLATSKSPNIDKLDYEISLLDSMKPKDKYEIEQWNNVKDVVKIIKEGEILAKTVGVLPTSSPNKLVINDIFLRRIDVWLADKNQVLETLAKSELKDNMYRKCLTTTILALNNRFAETLNCLILYRDVQDLHNEIQGNLKKGNDWKYGISGRTVISEYNKLISKVPSQSDSVKETAMYKSLTTFKPINLD